MRRCVSFLAFVLLAGSFVSAQAESSATALARVLASKGLISREELSRVETASADDAVRMLTSLLTRRGVLTTEEASLVLPAQPGAPAAAGVVSASATTPAAIVPAIYEPVATAAAATIQPPQSVRETPGSPNSTVAAAPTVTTASKIPISLYGNLVVNGFLDTALPNNQDIPLVLAKAGSDALGNDKSFGMTARQSRLGLRITPIPMLGGKLTGNVEVDFLGDKAAFPNGISFDDVRLRTAYGRIDWEHWAFEAGQDWSVFAPVNPVSYASYAIPLFAASGNLWIRSPQIRGEYKTGIAHDTKILFQMSASDPNVGDFPTTAPVGVRTPLAGERGRMPAIDSRLAFLGKIGGRDASIGFSGHYNRAKNSGTLANGSIRQVGFDSWGAAFDATLPIAKRFSLLGELYTGRALGVYSGSLGLSYLPVGTAGERGVLTRGGWAQAQFFATPKVQFNLGYGIDGSDANTLRVGDRFKNQSYDMSIFYKFVPAFTMAWEYRRMLSDFRNQAFANERGDVASMSVIYSF